jgi:hypothetical protein
MEEWIEGQQRFIDYNCPVKECLLTSDYENKSLTADALLITKADSNSVKKHLPKPSHQIWIVRHQVIFTLLLCFLACCEANAP